MAGGGERARTGGGEQQALGSQLQVGAERAVEDGELQKTAAASTPDVDGESEVGNAGWWSPDRTGGIVAEYVGWGECVMGELGMDG
jgi:hypothetical protein